ncbi:MAG: 50S ribosomal protein L3 N(5)-glutamine methyltransferase [Acidiferrobacterales bacterium]
MDAVQSALIMNPKNRRQSTTVRQLVLWGERQLREAGVTFGHGTDNALDESAWLVGSAIGVAPTDLESRLDRTVGAPDQAAARQIIELRIATRKPAAYLLREAWFTGLRFYVDERVIVPRSLIGEFVLDEFQPWIDSGRVGRVLDLCTGSGCIAVALANAFPQAQVDAADISAGALEVARINVGTHGLGKRVRLIQSDLFRQLSGKRYDLIVSNPPYVAADELASLPAEYRHEPELALASGADGLEAVGRILVEAQDHLASGGILVVEVGNSREALERRFAQVPFVWLSTRSGDESVFLLDQAELVRHRAALHEASGIPDHG